jgi:hypothetical protein
MNKYLLFIGIYFFQLISFSISFNELNFNKNKFESKIDNALIKIRKIIDNNKYPLLPASQVNHKYDDKFILTEFLVNIALSSNTISFESFGMNNIDKLVNWSKDNIVTLRFKSEETCNYIRMDTKEIEKGNQREETTNMFGSKKVKRMITTINNFIYDYNVKYSIEACIGGQNSNNCVEFLSDSIGQNLITSLNLTSPKPVYKSNDNIEIDISDYLRNLDITLLFPKFIINRNDSKCVTPSRNTEINQIMKYFSNLNVWSIKIKNYFHQIYQVSKHLSITSNINSRNIFIPIIPFLINEKKNVTIDSNTILMKDSLDMLLEEEYLSIKSKRDEFNENSTFLNDIISANSAKLSISMLHISDISDYIYDSITYVENLLQDQLTSAIGKEINPHDITSYMNYYSKKLFKSEYASIPLSYAVRRSNEHSPEGLFTIEENYPNQTPLPIYTITNKFESSLNKSSNIMTIPIDATTKIKIVGDKYVHTYLQHKYKTSNKNNMPQLNLIARARQFSSFMLLLGKISSIDTFEPTHGIIIKNNELFKIPLVVNTIPTTKEFRESISSLSSNQQEFVSAFRNMQLESTLFGIVIIQIKPQLEKILNLLPNSLQKEISLTEDLMDLFINYQIPADLLLSEINNSDNQLNQVKENVESIQKMIAKSKEKELKDKKDKDEYNNLKHKNDGHRRLYDDVILETSGGQFGNIKGSSMRHGMPTIQPSGTSDSESSVEQTMASFSSPVMMMDMTSNGMNAEEFGRNIPDVINIIEENNDKTSNNNDNYINDNSESSSSTIGSFDITSLPTSLQNNFENFGDGNVLRPTIVSTGNDWSFHSRKSMFSDIIENNINLNEQSKLRQKTFDLLDALTKLGAMRISNSDLHVFIASTHVFDKSLVNTVIQDNINPILKIEQSLLIMANVVHNKPISELVNPSVKISHLLQSFNTTSNLIV